MKKIIVNARIYSLPFTNTHLRSAKYSTRLIGERKTGEYPKFSVQNKYLWDQVLPSIIVDKTTNDWDKVRDKLLSYEDQITTNSIDSIILKFCIKLKNYEMAYNYMEYLKQINIKPNLATVGNYFKLFYLTNEDKLIDTKRERDIINLYTEIRQTYKLLDGNSCECMIQALSLTSHWKECLKLLDEIKIGCIPSSIAYSLVAAAAFRNNDKNTGLQLLAEAIDEGRHLYDAPYLAYLDKARNNTSVDRCINKLEELFEFLKVNGVGVSENVAAELNSLRDLRIKTKIVKINPRGICPQCKTKLETYSLNQHEFEVLKKAIFDDVIVGKNVFCRTTPAELENFKQFIDNMPKYDVVIDGLNVAYSCGSKNMSSSVYSTNVGIAVKHFVERKKKVLVLGRAHMKRWPNWSRLTQNADCFLAENLSHDDPYLLYCALHSGMNTQILSRDLMRGHLFRLNLPQLKLQFRLWLMQNQLQVQSIYQARQTITFRFPLPYTKIVQKQNNCWHLPFEGDENEKRWICLQH